MPPEVVHLEAMEAEQVQALVAGLNVLTPGHLQPQEEVKVPLLARHPAAAVPAEVSQTQVLPFQIFPAAQAHTPFTTTFPLSLQLAQTQLEFKLPLLSRQALAAAVEVSQTQVLPFQIFPAAQAHTPFTTTFPLSLQLAQAQLEFKFPLLSRQALAAAVEVSQTQLVPFHILPLAHAHDVLLLTSTFPPLQLPQVQDALRLPPLFRQVCAAAVVVSQAQAVPFQAFPVGQAQIPFITTFPLSLQLAQVHVELKFPLLSRQAFAGVPADVSQAQLFAVGSNCFGDGQLHTQFVGSKVAEPQSDARSWQTQLPV